ncbi:MAG TPA: hypothetical protein VFQ85_14815 [Mycobacteriales bacterium]|jgi:hypothetical protein|nr:hypothetical protein [Mycobacteriales bacterium]
MKRTLTLKREPLAELVSTELTSVVGAGQLSGLTCPVYDCVSEHQTCDITYQPRCF